VAAAVPPFEGGSELFSARYSPVPAVNSAAKPVRIPGIVSQKLFFWFPLLLGTGGMLAGCVRRINARGSGTGSGWRGNR